MNTTIVGIAMFLSFTASIGFCVWLASRGQVGAAVLLSLFVLLFFWKRPHITERHGNMPKVWTQF